MTLKKSAPSAREQRRSARATQRRNRNLLLVALAVIVLGVLGYFAWSTWFAQPGGEAGGETITTETGLQYQDLVVGDGPVAQSGNTVRVHYTGWLTDGTEFDSSVGGNPFQFTLGAGRVIRGWDEGVSGMQVGGKRRLTIPPDLGYGSQGAGGVIPPNATLIFEVELLEIAN